MKMNKKLIYIREGRVMQPVVELGDLVELNTNRVHGPKPVASRKRLMLVINY